MQLQAAMQSLSITIMTITAVMTAMMATMM
jgi:hypothetical protein